MSQNDDQNRDRQNQGEDVASDQPARESRGDRTQDSAPQSDRASRPDQVSDLDDADEMDEEDRDDDSRSDGSSNRRRNIG